MAGSWRFRGIESGIVCEEWVIGAKLWFSCKSTESSGSLEIGLIDNQAWDEDILDASGEELDAVRESAASWLNPYYTSWDPVMISGTVLTVSASSPSIAISTASATKTTQTAISVASCDLKTTTTSSQTSTYCVCDGGYGLSASTKTNAAYSMYLIFAILPPLTITTIKPRPSTTIITTKGIATTTGSAQSATGFVGFWLAETIECKIDGALFGACLDNPDHNVVYVIPERDEED
ncbi:hypothetical protein BDW59DRAFT_165963 [Aspergillus cavernicola]|uniref:Uncharacterized protein n=1 Tax=Aspergillus cavernicola TaxID=176166 RepID=A0ABR4HPN0_9EURO